MKGLQVYQPPPHRIPSILPFRSGGFYDAAFPFNSTVPNTTTNTSYLWLLPSWIPLPSLLVKLGIEVTTFNDAASCRIAMYDAAFAWDAAHRRPVLVPYPDKLICETGAISLGTSNDYKSGAVTYRNGYEKLPQGLCFAAFNQYGAAAATVRANANAVYTGFLGCGYPTSTNSALWVSLWGVLRIDAFSLLNTAGWPRRFPMQSMAANTMQNGTVSHPRVVMEF